MAKKPLLPIVVNVDAERAREWVEDNMVLLRIKREFHNPDVYRLKKAMARYLQCHCPECANILDGVCHTTKLVILN